MSKCRIIRYQSACRSLILLEPFSETMLLVVRFRHLAPIARYPRPNVGIARTTRNDKVRVAFLNLTFVRRDCGIGDTNVKFTPLEIVWEA
jgi:hypothetical protein